MTIGDRIKELRIKANMSQVEFADKINVSKQTLYKYENNIITNIPSDKIEAIANSLGTSPSYLMGWESESERQWAIDSLHISQGTGIASLYYFGFDDLEVNHFKDFVQLNPSNMRKVDSYTKKLLSIQQMDEDLEVVAAHERTDIDVTEEMRRHDDDIMDDENF